MGRASGGRNRIATGAAFAHPTAADMERHVLERRGAVNTDRRIETETIEKHAQGTTVTLKLKEIPHNMCGISLMLQRQA